MSEQKNELMTINNLILLAGMAYKRIIATLGGREKQGEGPLPDGTIVKFGECGGWMHQLYPRLQNTRHKNRHRP